MKKTAIMLITLSLALMMAVSGCSNANAPAATVAPTAAPTVEPTVDPLAEYPITGPWGLSVSKNDMAALYTVFGSSLKDYGAAMEIKDSGEMSLSVGVAGGAGSYSRTGSTLAAQLTDFNEGSELNLELSLSQEGGQVYLVTTLYDTALFWTQNEEDQAKAVPPQEQGADLYASVLERYYTALSEQYDDLQLSQENMSYMLMFHYEGNSLDNMGYCFLDLNGDDVPELLIGQLSGDEFFDKLIYDLYTIEDGQPKLLLSSIERGRYYLCADNSVYYTGSSGAFETVYGALTLSDGEMRSVTELASSASSDGNVVWTSTVDGQSQSISQDEVDSISANLEASIIKPEYTPFSALK